MSDFVSRVAARAVGRAAVARPRLPALFEPGGAGAGLEVVEEVVAPRPRTLVRPAEFSPQPSASPAAGPKPPVSRRSRAAEAPAPTAAPERPSPAVRRDDNPAATRQRSESRDDTIVEQLTAVEDATVLVAAAAPAATVAAGPAAPAKQAVLPEAQPPRSAATSPPVRVHIGRLEVRANLQEPPRPQRPAERPRSQELSLGDYLRGRRSAS